MDEITKETVFKFIQEYEALCLKYNLYVSAGETCDLDLFKVSQNCSDFSFWLLEWELRNITNSGLLQGR